MPFRSGAHGTFVPCGTCSACKAEKANRRASLIRSTNPPDTVCYFVNLTYSNEFLPYVNIFDVEHEYNRYIDYSYSHEDASPFVVPVYRNSYYTFGHGSSIKHEGKKQIGYIVRDVLKTTPDEFSEEIGCLMPVVSGKSGFDMSDCISVCFNDDKDRFFNRLRKRIFQHLGTYDTLKYFYCPEYGPTTCRFHIHLLIWVDNRIDYSTFKQICKDCWPYMDYNLPKNRDFCQVAINPSDYVSQYVNCSAEVSPFLLDFAPLRSSHSVGIGFDSPELQLESVTPSDYYFNFDYIKEFIDSSGAVKSYHFTLPPRVGYRYFPRCKGFSRLNLPKMLALYERVFYMPVLTLNCGYRSSLHKTEDLFYMPGTDVFGQTITVTQSEYRTFRNRLIKGYLRFRELRPCSLENYFRQIFSYYSKFSIFRYKLQFTHPDYHGFSDFDNMDEDISTIVPDGQMIYSCNKNPINIEYTKDLTDKFNRNIKQRKLNYSHS